MKLNTVVVTIKGLCYVLVGTFTPWAAAMGQWVNSGEWPPRIVWVAVILPLSAIGAASSLLSFLSSTFKDFKEEKDEEAVEAKNALAKVEVKT